KTRVSNCLFDSPNWSPTFADTHGLMPPAPAATRISPIASTHCCPKWTPNEVSISASVNWPRQYTIDRKKIVLYLPSQPSAMIAPKNGIQYTDDTNWWNQPCASFSGIP